MTFIGQCWRCLGTAASFAVFGIGSLVIGVVILPLVVLCVRSPERRLRAVRTIVGSAMSLFITFLRLLGLLRYRISGMEHVDPNRGYLIIANHPSLIDVVFLLSLFPMADCVIKGKLLQNPLLHNLLRTADYIANTDAVSLMEQAVGRLKKDRSLILFPEGTRTGVGQPLHFRAGAAAIALRSGVDCLPVVIHCVPRVLTRTDHWYHIPPQRVFVSVAIQPAINPGSVLEGSVHERHASRCFSAYLQAYFTERLGTLSDARGH